MDVTEHARTYWQYEYDVSSRYMVPLLRQWGRAVGGMTVIDVGCGEGGGVCAMHDHGARCVGFDVDEQRVNAAVELKGNRDIAYAVRNLYAEHPPDRDEKYDLVMLHDVFEHLDDKVKMIKKLMGFMKPEGAMLLTFPPYYSAYGAHQQHLRAPLARLPFFHLIPFSLSVILPRLKDEYPHIVEEVRKLGRLKMGMRSFEDIVARGGLRIMHRRAYLVSPNHIRFGLSPLSAGPLAAIPLIREVVCSGVVYLLSKQQRD
jgi:ubiquinone/menaquinone biosynthesis C-methylase UbiE